MERVKPNILVTGTPGTGKSTVGQRAADILGFKFVKVSEVAFANGFIEGLDEKFNSYDLDEEKLLDFLETTLGSAEGGNIVEYHACELFPERWFDLVIVLRCSTEVLYDRLTARGYEGTKLESNMECEVFGTVAEEAKEAYDEAIVHERQNNDADDLEQNVQAIVTWVQSL